MPKPSQIFLMETIPGFLLFWISISPFDTQAAKWAPEYRQRHDALFDKADIVTATGHAYSKSSIFARNRYLVDNADMLLAAYDGQPGGTEMTIKASGLFNPFWPSHPDQQTGFLGFFYNQANSMAQNVRVIPATLNRATQAPIASAAKRKVAGYARVSTDLEEQQTSYEAQVDYYTHYIQGREDWEFVSVYTDEGISATSTRHREGFQQMVEDALAGRIEISPLKLIQAHNGEHPQKPLEIRHFGRAA